MNPIIYSAFILGLLVGVYAGVLGYNTYISKWVTKNREDIIKLFRYSGNEVLKSVNDPVLQKSARQLMNKFEEDVLDKSKPEVTKKMRAVSEKLGGYAYLISNFVIPFVSAFVKTGKK